MITVTCDKTGITFEADSRRQKNHPKVSALLNDAARDKYNTGAYNAALAAFAQVKATGGYTIDDAIAYAQAAMTGNVDAHKERQRQAAERDRQLAQAREDAKEKRRQQNEHLKAHGYRWTKTYADFDEYEEGEPSQWTLFAPGDVAVSVTQALDEIARGADVVRAEIAAKEAVAAARVEAATLEEQRKRDEFSTALAAATAGMAKVNAFDYSGFSLTSEYRHPSSYIAMYDQLHTGTINGVACAVAYSYIGGHDWTEYVNYYCANPVTAGLEVLPATTGIAATLQDFFGK